MIVVHPDLSCMYKDFKSLKDIYKDKCNLQVTFRNPVEIRVQTGARGWGGAYQSGRVHVPQQDSTELSLKSGMIDQDLGMSKNTRDRLPSWSGASKYRNSNRMSEGGGRKWERNQLAAQMK